MKTTRVVPAPNGPKLLQGWLARHQHPFSFYLHLVGIPMTLAAVPLLFRHQWRTAARFFGGGYALQFLGHLVEGNPPGELLALQRRYRGAGGQACGFQTPFTRLGPGASTG